MEQRNFYKMTSVSLCLLIILVVNLCLIEESSRNQHGLVEGKIFKKVAKVLYIKKKIKKLGKKLKKHTIAVPVFTAIPIYEHSYYPQPHVTHVAHHHGGGGGHHGGHHGGYAASATHVMPTYSAPSYHPAPSYVDDSGGIYGFYGNAYGRYDGGYHHWM